MKQTTIRHPLRVPAVVNAVRAPAAIHFVQSSEHQDWGKIPDGTQTFTLSQE